MHVLKAREFVADLASQTDNNQQIISRFEWREYEQLKCKIISKSPKTIKSGNQR